MKCLICKRTFRSVRPVHHWDHQNCYSCHYLRIRKPPSVIYNGDISKGNGTWKKGRLTDEERKISKNMQKGFLKITGLTQTSIIIELYQTIVKLRGDNKEKHCIRCRETRPMKLTNCPECETLLRTKRRKIHSEIFNALDGNISIHSIRSVIYHCRYGEIVIESPYPPRTKKNDGLKTKPIPVL